jgi:uncharacterized protein YabN with tetrapyrrole methylase and pyrophosphatase domain
VTLAAQAELERADEVLLVASDITEVIWLQQVNPNTRSLNQLYERGKHRREIYEAMVEEILAPVRRGKRVCAAFYGHPGVYVTPSHEAVRRARAEGFPARMLPGVSAEDCLFADLGVNPGARGWQSYEATSLLLRRHTLDPTAALVLWQVDAVGKVTYDDEPVSEGLHVLADYLLQLYPPEHRAVFYTAALHAIAEPLIEPVALGELAAREGRPPGTLYVPPLPARRVDETMAQKLGLR